MPRPVAVLGHLFGTHTHAIAHWFGDIPPSITFEPALYAIILLPDQENPHAFGKTFGLTAREVPRYENGQCHAP